MSWTSKFYDNAGVNLIGPIETSDVVIRLVQILKVEGFNVGIMKLIRRRENNKSNLRLNQGFGNVAKELNVRVDNKKVIYYT